MAPKKAPPAKAKAAASAKSKAMKAAPPPAPAMKKASSSAKAKAKPPAPKGKAKAKAASSKKAPVVEEEDEEDEDEEDDDDEDEDDDEPMEDADQDEDDEDEDEEEEDDEDEDDEDEDPEAKRRKKDDDAKREYRGLRDNLDDLDLLGEDAAKKHEAAQAEFEEFEHDADALVQGAQKAGIKHGHEQAFDANLLGQFEQDQEILDVIAENLGDQIHLVKPARKDEDQEEEIGPEEKGDMDKNITYLFIEPTELESGFAKTVAVYDQINRFWRFKTDAQSVREVEMGQVQGAKIVEMGIEDYKEDLRDRAEQRRLNRRGSDQNRVPRVPGAPKEPRVKRADREPKEPRAPKKEVVISDVADVSALMEELKINPLKYGKLDENLQQQVLARDPNIEIAFKQKEMESGRRQAFEKLQGSKIGSMFLEKFKMFQELAYLRSKDLTGKREGETQWSGPVSPDQPMTKEGFAAGKSQLDGVKAEVNRIKVSVAASEENKDDTEAINKKVNEKIAQLDKERQSKIESLTKRLTAAQQHVKIDMRHWRLMRPDPGYDPDKKDDGLDPEKRGKTGWEDVDDEPNEALRKRAIRRHQTRPHPEELFKNLSPDEMIHQKLTFIGVEANARRVAMEELGRRHKLGKAIRNKDTTATHKVFGTQIKTFPGRVEARVAHTLAGMATVYPEETHVDNQQIVRLEDDRFMGPTLKARATMAMRYNLLMGGNVSYTGKGLEDVRVLQPVLPMDEAGRSMAFEGGLTAAGGFTQAVADHGGFTEMGGGMSVVDDMMGGGGGMTVHGMDVDQGDSDEDEDAKARNEKFALY